jgi:diketogulonate reductase-like aldo/keto reductase
MLTRRIPSTGEQLPIVGIGTYKGFDVGPREPRTGVSDVLRTLYAAGGSVIDSSPMYGRAEEVAGDLITEQGAREKTFLATKVWVEGRNAGIEQMTRSMKLLRCEKVDLMQIHNLVDWRTHLATLRAWKQEGRIRYLGVTHYNASAYKDLENIMRSESLDFVQLNYSLDERQAEERLLPLAADRGIAILANCPFGQGRLHRKRDGKTIPAWAREAGCESWSEILLKFTLSQKAVTCTIPGTRNAEHMAENCRAGDGALFDKPVIKQLVEYWSEVGP